MKLDGNYKTSRMSNFELLRIIAMFLLVAHHLVYHGGLIQNIENLGQRSVALIFFPLGKMAFIAFLVISSYFMQEKTFKATRFVDTWLEVFFYSVLFVFVSWLINGNIGIRGFISCFFPIIGNSHGFASSYLLLYLLLPILQKVRFETKEKHTFFIVLLFIIQIFSQIFGKIFGYVQPISSELTLFIFVFFITGYLKKYPVIIMNHIFFNIFVLAFVYFIVYINSYFIYVAKAPKVYEHFFYVFSSDESCIFNIIGGFSLFYLFKNIKIKTSIIINKIASFTFGILLIHDHNFFRYVLWKNIIHTEKLFFEDFVLIKIFYIVFIIFSICALCDFLRQIIHILVKKWNLYKYCVLAIDHVWGEK